MGAVSDYLYRLESGLSLHTSPHSFRCRLKKLLREKLEECGWRDEVKAHCRSKWTLQDSTHKLCAPDRCLSMPMSFCSGPLALHICGMLAGLLKDQPSLTEEELVDQIRTKGRASVPDSVKADLLARLRTQITG